MASQLAPSSRHQFTYEGRLVYEWDQTLSDLTLYLTVPAGTRGKQLYCDIQPTSIKIGIQPNPPYLQGKLSGAVLPKESYWTLDDGVMTVTLQKRDEGEPWPCVIEGHGLDSAAQQKDTERLMLERFQMEHPGFDFSGAQFNGQVPNPRTFMRDESVESA